jgi:WD40 repeat protein
LKKKTVTHGTSLAIDPQGLLFAATFPENTVKLFDFRELAKGPFSTFALKDSINYDFTGIKISPDGKWIILTTLQGDVLVVDSFEGKLHTKLMGVKNESSTVMEACVTPDSRYVLAGLSSSNCIHFMVPEAQNGHFYYNRFRGWVCHSLEHGDRGGGSVLEWPPSASWSPSFQPDHDHGRLCLHQYRVLDAWAG